MRDRPKRITGVWPAVLWAVLALTLRPAPEFTLASPPASSLVIWSFDSTHTNSLGGEYNTFSKEPSWSRIYLDPSVRRAPAGHSLRVTAHQEAQGFCGVWFDLYPGGLGRVLDAVAYRDLSFWIRADDRNTPLDFSLKLVDAAHKHNDESLPTLGVEGYLQSPMGLEWQHVQIPLHDFDGIDRGRLVRMVLIFKRPGDYRFHLDSIGLQSSGSASQAESSPVAEPSSPTGGPAIKVRGRGMWVWEASAIIGSAAKADEFFAFCDRNQIRDIYLAPGYSAAESESPPISPDFRIALPEHHAFISRAHQKGLRVEALLGDPEWAAQKNHESALAAVDSVLDFNRQAAATAEFDGIHLDVEPYVLAGFVDREYRNQLLGEFLQLVSRCAARVRAEPGVTLTCDVPWWFYPTQSPDREDLTLAFQGQSKTVGEHLTSLLEKVTLMDYRNQAAGAGGIVAGAEPALAYAASIQKQIVVGLETYLQPGTPVYFAFRLPAAEFHQRLGAAGLLSERFFHGYLMSAVVDGNQIYLGLGLPAPSASQPVEPVDTALAALAAVLKADEISGHFSIPPPFTPLPAPLAQNPELEGLQPFTLSTTNGHELAGYRGNTRMAPSVTFSGLGRTVFDEEARSAGEWLSRYPSFAGLAIHSYEAFVVLETGHIMH